MERINGTKIALERLSNEELENLKEHVLRKLDEVMEDVSLVMEELSKRPLEHLDSEIYNTEPSEPEKTIQGNILES